MTGHKVDSIDRDPYVGFWSVVCECGWFSDVFQQQYRALRQFHEHANEMAETELTRGP